MRMLLRLLLVLLALVVFSAIGVLILSLLARVLTTH